MIRASTTCIGKTRHLAAGYNAKKEMIRLDSPKISKYYMAWDLGIVFEK